MILNTPSLPHSLTPSLPHSFTPLAPQLPMKKDAVLVVEDELHLATGIRYALERENYAVTTVDDGPSALELLRDDPARFDLIVLDLMLPGMSGYTVCETLRNNKNFTPVLILSARTLSEDRTRGFDVGANQYLTKPFELDEFLARVRNLIAFHRRQNAMLEEAQNAAKKEEPEPVIHLKSLEFGGAHVNFETFEVRVGSETTRSQRTFRLTHMEIRVLQYFAEHPNRLIPKEELLEKVWDVRGLLNTREPDQFILRLRKIFEPDPSEPIYFLTVRNAGYRFSPDGEG